MIPRKPSRGDSPDKTTQSASDLIDTVEALRHQQHAQMPGDQWRDTIPLGNVVKLKNNHATTGFPWYGVAMIENSRHNPSSEGISGSLTTRGGDTSGTITTDEPHTIQVGDIITVFWTGNLAYDGEVTAVTDNTITFYGTSGDDLPAQDTAVTIINQSVPGDVDGFKNEILFGATVPNAEQEEIYGITQEPINPDEVGDVMLQGVTQVQLVVTEDTVNQVCWAEPILNDVTKLQCTLTPTPIEVLWRPTDQGGTVWGIVRLINSMSRESGNWAVCKSGINNNGNVTRTFSVVSCDWDGSNERGSPFSAKTLVRANYATALFYGWVVRIELQSDGNHVIMGQCWDDKIDSLRQVRTATGVPNGWEEVPESEEDRLIKVAGGAATPLETFTGTTEHRHCAHGTQEAGGGPGGAIWPFPSEGSDVHTLESHEPSWIAYTTIMRNTDFEAP